MTQTRAKNQTTNQPANLQDSTTLSFSHLHRYLRRVSACTRSSSEKLSCT